MGRLARNSWGFPLPFVLLVALAFTASASAADSGANPGSYGKIVLLNIGMRVHSRDPSVLTVITEQSGLAVGVEVPMSRIHFANVSGGLNSDVLIISSPDGTVIEEMKLSDFGSRTRFWSSELPGTSFKVRAKTSPKSRLAFKIDKILLPDIKKEPESIIVSDDNQPIYKLPADSRIRTLSLSVVRISIGQDGENPGLRCTGFMIETDEVLTNAHCVSTTQLCSDTIVEFGVADVGPDSPVAPAEQIRCKELVGWPNGPDGPGTLDFAVFRLVHKPKRDWGRLVLSKNPPCVDGQPSGCMPVGKLALIHQYNGQGKQVSMDTCNVSVLDVADKAKLGPDRFGHSCNTSRMSSGAPLIDVTSGKVVGLHYAGAEQDLCVDCFNRATKSTAILRALDSWPADAQSK